MVLDHVYNAVWGLVAPDSYYRELPGADAAGASDHLNQVLVRDLSTGRLVLAVVLTVGAVLLERRVLLLALAAGLVSGVIRFADHLLSNTGDEWTNWFGYSIAVALPVVLLSVVSRTPPRPPIDEGA